ncbi:GNAT family N-acetyltransferase [Streptomyces oceani]|uniref:Acetyltransferase n=1 Tax=Streptomyces oceani TaxID=1075402 RepID=A0A1E7KFT4_9ACTN|nr:GNAT family N-acetyltransferase [Streptomyces oceani]OEV02744.1 acetyltransferase [Streptomyces oceani]
MPELTEPTTDVHASFLTAMGEFAAEGRGAATDRTSMGSALRAYGQRWHDPAVFARHVAELRAEARAPARDGFVRCTTLWYLEAANYLGRIAIRHELNDFLRDYGGHIGYDVRPAARRRGHATAMLRAALPRARYLGLGSVLVTCDTDNIASRRVIENCGGLLEDRRGAKLRYWIATD